MARSFRVDVERFPIAGSFTISRGTKTEAEVITCSIGEAGYVGRGECVPYPRYDESAQTVQAALESIGGDIQNGLSRKDLQAALPAGAARNAVDCALWDLEAK
ncbi:MAG: dipeptide epimerase, partial [Nitratireductor sp.]